MIHVERKATRKEKILQRLVLKHFSVVYIAGNCTDYKFVEPERYETPHCRFVVRLRLDMTPGMFRAMLKDTGAIYSTFFGNLNL
jgi:hypothetical protein